MVAGRLAEDTLAVPVGGRDWRPLGELLSGSPPVPPPGPGPANSTEPAPAGGTIPRLWNPNAAANWSLLLTPAFGAYLHARNWDALGRPDKATANRVWVWLTVGLLGLDLALVGLANWGLGDKRIVFGGGAVLVFWYFIHGRGQIGYVADRHGRKYARKGWAGPLLAAVGGLVAYYLLCVAVAAATHTPDVARVTADTKQAILADWAGKPGLRGATIDALDLAHAGGNTYTGLAAVTVDGRTEQLTVDVVDDETSLVWHLRPTNAGQASPGTRLEFHGGDLYYTTGVTADEATRLGEYLVREQYFDGDPKTV